MFSQIGESIDDSFHNIFLNGDWSLEKIKNDFGDTPSILTRVLQRRSCSANVVKLLLKDGADVNCNDGHSYSPLMIALKITNDKEVIRALLEGGAEVNEVEERNRTPLIIYLEREDCSVDIVTILLEFNADVNHKDEYGHPPLTTAIRNAKDNAVIQILLENGADVNRNFHTSPLFLLLRERKHCSADTVKLLLAYDANTNCVDNQGGSLLACALQNFRDPSIIEALLEKGANVNRGCTNETPLSLFLGRYFADNCSLQMIKLLLRYKADVKYTDISGDSPLTKALKDLRSEKIVELLLEGGACVNTLDCTKRSPLCIAFRYSSNDIVKLLLEAGASPSTCRYHKNPLHCATDFSNSGLREDILTLLIEANVDVNFIDNDGQSVVCFALQNGAKAKDVQLLLNAGASMNSCEMHTTSPLVCATSVRRGTPLRAEVIKLLLDYGASVDVEHLNILQDALYFSEYDTGAIQLLLDLPGMDAYVIENKLILHHAVQNQNCRLNVVKLLLNRKAQVLSIDFLGKTALHYAARNKACDPNVIKLLLENGSPVNAKSESETTPLMMTKNHFEFKIVKELLLAGAHITTNMFGKIRRRVYRHGLFEFLIREWKICDYPKRLSSYKMLAKFFLLQNPEFVIENFQQTIAGIQFSKLWVFLNECLIELGKMNSLQVSDRHTFRMLVARDCLSVVEENYDFDKILIYLSKNSFPIFFDVISARIGRSIMEAEVKKLQLYTNKIHSIEQVNLNGDIMYLISKYLPDEDLLKFILAFYKPFNNKNDCGETNKDDPLLGKRSCELSLELAKCPKLYH